jgi:uncharacterized membrane protein YvbJ
MGVQAGLIACPHCGNHVQDTKQQHIDCSFCGKRFQRGTIAKEKEEEIRRTMVLDLTDSIQKKKVIILAGKIFGGLFLLLFFILLFSEAFTIFEIIIAVVLLVNGVVWLGLATAQNTKMQKEQSKMFDLSGGRDVFEY